MRKMAGTSVAEKICVTLELPKSNGSNLHHTVAAVQRFNASTSKCHWYLWINPQLKGTPEAPVIHKGLGGATNN